MRLSSVAEFPARHLISQICIDSRCLQSTILVCIGSSTYGMPAVKVLFFREDDEVPVLDWLLSDPNEEAQDRCVTRIEMLSDAGHAARRPLVENLGRGIYELRARVGRQNYRILFFFFERAAVVLTSGFTKEREVSRGEIDLALERKAAFEESPETHYADVDL